MWIGSASECITGKADTGLFAKCWGRNCQKPGSYFIKANLHVLKLEKNIAWNAGEKKLGVRNSSQFRWLMLVQILYVQMPTKVRKSGSRPTFFIQTTKLSHQITFCLLVARVCWFFSPVMLFWYSENGVTWDKLSKWRCCALDAQMWMFWCNASFLISGMLPIQLRWGWLC